MSIYMQIECSMCGKCKEPFSVGKAESKGTLTLVDAVRKGLRRPWVVQVNGDNIDTYYCAKCAE